MINVEIKDMLKLYENIKINDYTKQFFRDFILPSNDIVKIFEKKNLNRNEYKLFNFILDYNINESCKNILSLLDRSNNKSAIVKNLVGYKNRFINKYKTNIINMDDIDNHIKKLFIPYINIQNSTSMISILSNITKDLDIYDKYYYNSIISAKFIIEMKRKNNILTFELFEELYNIDDDIANRIVMYYSELKMLKKDFRNKYNRNDYKFKDYKYLYLYLKLNNEKLKDNFDRLINLYKDYKNYYNNVVYKNIIDKYGEKEIYNYLKRVKNHNQNNRDYNEWLFKDILRNREIENIMKTVLLRIKRDREKVKEIEL